MLVLCFYNPGGCKILLHPSRLALGHTQPPTQCLSGLFSDIKRPGHGVNNPTPSSAKVEERIQLYLCFHSEPSWPIPVRTSPLSFTTLHIPALCSFYRYISYRTTHIRNYVTAKTTQFSKICYHKK